MQNVLIIDRVSEKLLNELSRRGFGVDYRPGLERSDLLEIINKYSILVFRGRLRIDKDVIDAGERLRVLARYGIGLDNVDVEYAIKKGISVVNAPNASCISVVELTIGLMIVVFRNIYNYINLVKLGEWPKGIFIGRELYGKNLGIVGFGRIGSRVARYAKIFGMNILVHDVRDVSKDVRELGGVQVNFEELLKESDIVTLHVPLTPLTYHMIDDYELSLMKDGAVIINTSRGEVVNARALIRHLDRLGGVALDVMEQEPPRDEIYRRLIAHPKVIVTPHIGAETVESMDRIADELLHNILDAVKWL
ncbi:MAG: D-2-hydroxyacid dehydrogenase [Ignisphaera sp.]|uniref:3-phosphoglycerate dehydrogenase n=1 Tax=Ignisphaera aggregans TaxID=334771 RepID=A0A7J3I7C1_9CREN